MQGKQRKFTSLKRTLSKEMADKFKGTVQPKNNAGARSWQMARTSKPQQEAKMLYF